MRSGVIDKKNNRKLLKNFLNKTPARPTNSFISSFKTSGRNNRSSAMKSTTRASSIIYYLISLVRILFKMRPIFCNAYNFWICCLYSKKWWKKLSNIKIRTSKSAIYELENSKRRLKNTEQMLKTMRIPKNNFNNYKKAQLVWNRKTPDSVQRTSDSKKRTVIWVKTKKFFWVRLMTMRKRLKLIKAWVKQTKKIL